MRKTLKNLLILALIALFLHPAAGMCADPVIAAGGDHSVALKTDGSLWSWGRNDYGQLGVNAWTDWWTPVQVLGLGGTGYLTDVMVVAAGEDHTVAVKEDGTVWAWGGNYSGQLGDDTTLDYSTPVQVLGPEGVGFLAGIKAITGGGEHSLVLKADGTVWAWGDDTFGQLGDGTSSYYMIILTPVQVLGPEGVGSLSGVKAIAAGRIHTVALKNDGTVWAWGNNNYGQLGNGTMEFRRVTPVQVLGPEGAGVLSGVKAIAAGGYHTVALKTDGTVWAWGYNDHGQLGDNTTRDWSTPVQVLGPDGTGFFMDVKAITAGYEHTVALKEDGTVWAWGWNIVGQLGDNKIIGDSWTPVQVVGPEGMGLLEDIKAIASGFSHTLALKADGTLWAWGLNDRGQLGDNGSELIQKTPVQVLGPGDVGYFDIGTGPGPGPFSVRIPDTPEIYFEDISTAYDSALDQDVIQIQAGYYPGGLVMNRGIDVTLDGGYDSSFESVIWRSCIQGCLVIQSGGFNVKGMAIVAGP